MKIWGIPHNRRTIKHRHHLLIRKGEGDAYVVSSWPRGGQYDKSPDGYARSKTFGEVQARSSRPLPLEQLDCIEGSQGTMYLPRDLFTKMAYGRLSEIKFKDGTYLYSVKLMADEIQALLDSISISPGDLLYRKADGWYALTPGPAGNVLTTFGPGQLPQWEPVIIPSATPSAWQWIEATTIVGAGYATFGQVFTPLMDMIATAINIKFQQQPGGVYEWQLWTVDDVTLVKKLASAPIDTTQATVDNNHTITPQEPLGYSKGSSYALLLVRTDGTASWSANIAEGGSNNWAGPIMMINSGMRLWSIDPQPGDTLEYYSSLMGFSHLWKLP